VHSTLSSDLDQLFAQTVTLLTDPKENRGTELERNKWMGDLSECLRTYDSLGLWRDAEDVIRKEVIRAFVKKVLYILTVFLTTYLSIDVKDSPPQCIGHTSLTYCATHSVSGFWLTATNLRPSDPPNTVYTFHCVHPKAFSIQDTSNRPTTSSPPRRRR